MKLFKYFLITALMAVHTGVFSQGDLLVSPLRVVFESNKVKEELSIVNIGNDTAVYSVSFLQYNMTEAGNFEIIENPGPGQMFANQYLRIFPRTITLAPREAQVVRLQYRKSKDMVAGEYRSHIYFRSEKENKALGIENPYKDTTMMGVQITPIFGISIPVIIREGNVNVKSTLSDIKLETVQDTINNLGITINRDGNISTYGDLNVDYISNDGKSVNIGSIRGVSVYTTVNKRICTLKLNRVDGVDLSTGKLRVIYTSPKDTPYQIFAEKEIVLNH
jgi:hypothetical protein